MRASAVVVAVAAAVVAIFAACSSFEDAATEPGGADAAPDTIVSVDASDAAPALDANVDLAGDPKNCGALGHDCLGGACVAGRCQPVELFRGTDSEPGGMTSGRNIEPSIAVDATRVLWLLNGGNDGKVAGCPKSGCTGTTPALLAPITNGTTGSITADDTGAFVAVAFGGVGVYRVETNGVTRLTTTLDFMADVRLSGDRLYFTNRRATDQGGGIWSVMRDGNDLKRIAPKPVDGGSGEDDMLRVAIGKDAIFAASPSVVWGIPLEPSDATKPPGFVADVAGDTTGIVTDRTTNDLYWVDRSNQTIQRCAAANIGSACKTASTISQDLLTTRSAMPTALAFDGTRLFVTADVTGDGGIGSALYACVPADCRGTWTTIATAPLVYGAATADANAVYWMELVIDGDPKTYRIMKVAK